jgi:hypothetical protein
VERDKLKEYIERITNRRRELDKDGKAKKLLKPYKAITALTGV